MLAFTLRRAIQAIGVMIAVGIISFSMFRFAGHVGGAHDVRMLVG